jgi:hypothetical protein
VTDIARRFSRRLKCPLRDDKISPLKGVFLHANRESAGLQL